MKTRFNTSWPRAFKLRRLKQPINCDEALRSRTAKPLEHERRCAKVCESARKYALEELSQELWNEGVRKVCEGVRRCTKMCEGVRRCEAWPGLAIPRPTKDRERSPKRRIFCFLIRTWNCWDSNQQSFIKNFPLRACENVRRSWTVLNEIKRTKLFDIQQFAVFIFRTSFKTNKKRTKQVSK